MKTDDISFEMVEQCKYLGTNLKIKIILRKKLRAGLKSGNACCHSVQNILSFRVVSKNIRIKIYRYIVLPVVYGRVTWSLILREESRLRVFDNRVLKRIFGPKRDRITRNWIKLHNKELFIQVIKSRRIRRAEYVPHMGDRCIQDFGWET